MPATEIYRGDTPKFTFTIKEADGSVYSLAGVGIEVRFGAGVLGSTPVFNKLCTITDAPNGVCEVRLTATDTAQVGTFTGEVEVEDTVNSYHFTLPQFTLSIKPDIIP